VLGSVVGRNFASANRGPDAAARSTLPEVYRCRKVLISGS
jgi:hypothetical protein